MDAAFVQAVTFNAPEVVCDEDRPVLVEPEPPSDARRKARQDFPEARATALRVDLGRGATYNRRS
jgi:hypothetical protein